MMHFIPLCRLLEEEFAKREELERLQAEQRQQLLQEKMSRQELEEAHRQQEESLRLARDQLDALGRERQQVEEQLKVFIFFKVLTVCAACM